MSWEQIRSNLGGSALDLGLRGLSRLAALHPKARPSRYDVDVIQDIPYGPRGRDNLLDIYRPRNVKEGARPILYIHGGGFRILSKETHWVMALPFAAQGHVVFNINYRLAPQHPFPAGAEDVAQAALWVLKHAHEYGADISKLVVAGESAGANLALVLAIANAWRRPEPWAQEIFDAELPIKGLLPACGMLQVSDPTYRGTQNGFFLDRIRSIGEAYIPPNMSREAMDLVDVARFLEEAPPPERPLPPSFAVCGGNDPVRDDTERLTPAWRRLGGEASHMIYGRAIHAFHAFIWTKDAQQAWADQHRFIDNL